MIKCEVCGGNDIIKQDDMFVCQSCGCKYSVEDMRKMLGNSANVQSNNKDMERIKKLANDAFENEVWMDAAKYYTELIEKYDVDYEIEYRCLIAKVNINGNNSNGYPSLEKSINIAIDAFSKYRETLIADNSISQEDKEKKCDYYLNEISRSIRWLFNMQKNKYVDYDDEEKINVIYDKANHTKLLQEVKKSIAFREKFLEFEFNELLATPFLLGSFIESLDDMRDLIYWYMPYCSKYSGSKTTFSGGNFVINERDKFILDAEEREYRLDSYKIIFSYIKQIIDLYKNGKIAISEEQMKAMLDIPRGCVWQMFNGTKKALVRRNTKGEDYISEINNKHLYYINTITYDCFNLYLALFEIDIKHLSSHPYLIDILREHIDSARKLLTWLEGDLWLYYPGCGCSGLKLDGSNLEKVNAFKTFLSECEDAIKKEIQRLNDIYWENHKEEKQQLEKEKAELTDQIALFKKNSDEQIDKLTADSETTIKVYEQEIANIQGKETIKSYKSQIESNYSKISSLGIFKRKEKNALENEIYQLRDNIHELEKNIDRQKKAIEIKIENEKNNLNNACKQIRENFEKEVSPLKSRIQEIDEELAKERRIADQNKLNCDLVDYASAINIDAFNRFFSHGEASLDTNSLTGKSDTETIRDLKVAQQRFDELLKKDRELAEQRWRLENGVPFGTNKPSADYSSFGIISNSMGPVPTDFLLDDYTKKNNL